MKKLKAIINFIIVFFIYLFLNTLLASFFQNDLNSTSKLLSTTAYITIYLLSLTIFIFIFSNKLIKDFYNLKKENLKIGFKYWILGIVIMVISNIILMIILGDTTANENSNRLLIKNNLIFAIFAMSIYAPIVEESVFRLSLRNIFKNKYFYAISSGLIFGSLHLIDEFFTLTNPLYLFYIIPYGIMGFVFALSYYETDNIFSTIIFHSIHNSLAILLLV